MDGLIEHEVCANCKKEIPHFNYVMHMAHCARNIALCKTCKEPIPKGQMEEHQQTCQTRKVVKKKPSPPPTNIEKSSYYADCKAIQDKKVEARKEQKLQKYEKLVDVGYSLKDNSTNRASSPKTSTNMSSIKNSNLTTKEKTINATTPMVNGLEKGGAKPKILNGTGGGGSKKSLLPCKYCELELPKLDLEDHENYCGSRTDKCLECGELVMFKYKNIHKDSNHGFLKLKDEPGPSPSWDSTTQRSTSTTNVRHRPPPLRSFSTYDTTSYAFPSTYVSPAPVPKEKGESYKEISRRLDCKTEYIRNLLHDSASITVPLRHNGAVPRNHFNHNKGPAPQPPRRRNPPTELTIPCEFCDTPIPHEELIVHETGCRPDLARLHRRRSPEPDDYFIAPAPSSPEVELPCEFCADMIPASQLLRHQATCN